MILTLRTSQDASFSVTLDGDGNGILHAHPEGLCDKVRIRDWCLDNEDDWYVVDRHLTEEWDDLIELKLEEFASEWVNSDLTQQRLTALNAAVAELRQFDARTRAERAKIISKHKAVFRPLHDEAERLIGARQVLELSTTHYSCCSWGDVDCIRFKNTTLAEDISITNS